MTEITMQVLDCGRITLPRDQIVFAGGTDPVTVPVPAFLIRHPEGNLLFEGGMATDVKEMLADLPDYVIGAGPENHIAEQVRAAGLQPHEITHALTSHLHWDHIGAIGHFPEAEFLVHRQDWDYAHSPDWFVSFAYPLDTIDRPAKWTMIDSSVAEPEHDLFGDGSIITVLSPGHSPGLMSLIVRLEGGTVLLTSDAAVTADHWADQALPFYLDGPGVVQSVARLRHLVEKYDVQDVIFGHDLAQFESLKPCTEVYA